MAVNVEVTAMGAGPQPPAGLCAPAPAYVPARFQTHKIAYAVARIGEVEVEIYVEPVAVGVAPGYVTPLGEPCVALQTVAGWSVRRR